MEALFPRCEITAGSQMCKYWSPGYVHEKDGNAPNRPTKHFFYK